MHSMLSTVLVYTNIYYVNLLNPMTPQTPQDNPQLTSINRLVLEYCLTPRSQWVMVGVMLTSHNNTYINDIHLFRLFFQEKGLTEGCDSNYFIHLLPPCCQKITLTYAHHNRSVVLFLIVKPHTTTWHSYFQRSSAHKAVSEIKCRHKIKDVLYLASVPFLKQIEKFSST